jgi:hypothetical protein
MVVFVQETGLRHCREEQTLNSTEKPYQLINLISDVAGFFLPFVNSIPEQDGINLPFLQRYLTQGFMVHHFIRKTQQIPNLPLHLICFHYTIICVLLLLHHIPSASAFKASLKGPSDC